MPEGDQRQRRAGGAARDPYQTLGVNPGASDAELRSAYRRLAQLHHPDHNAGSAEAAQRFEEIQDAYARVKELRAAAPRPRAVPPRPRAAPPPTPGADPDLEARMADLERELREAQAARERARRAAREAAAQTSERPSDEELGYVKTDDSFAKILADARSEIADRLFGDEQHPAARRVNDLIDGLDELASKLGRRRPPGSKSQ